MCRCGCFSPRHSFWGGFRPRDIAHNPPPFCRRPQTDEEIHFMEEYKRDLEQELNEVNDRLRTLNNKD